MRVVALLCALLLTLAACSDEGSSASSENGEEQAAAGESRGETVELQRSWDDATVVPAPPGGPSASSVAASQAFFVTAPAVVVAPAGDQVAVEEAAQAATDAGVPLLLLEEPTSSGTSQSEADDAVSTSAPADDPASGVFEEVERLDAQTVLMVGPSAERTVAAALDVEVVTSADQLPSLGEVDGLADVVALMLDNDEVEPATRTALRATANAAGATVVTTDHADLRADPEAVQALAEGQPAHVVGLGRDFGSVDRLASRVELAKTGVELPGGGQAMFPGRRLVALYGTPGSGALGVLGEQDVEASIERATELAEVYAPLTDVPVVPTFEIIATVASSSAGSDGDYSREVDVSTLRPWVERAGEEGVYVVLDLQPGRSSFVEQAQRYEELLRLPHVGLALDAEWRLGPEELPLQRIGSVEAEEVNAVITWLADLTAEENLPQKLLVLHQFRTSMLPDSDTYDLDRDEVAVLVHMDGQGATGDKDLTWAAVTQAAPEGVPFGWKNFYDEDVPVLTPEETLRREPTPFMISYQ